MVKRLIKDARSKAEYIPIPKKGIKLRNEFMLSGAHEVTVHEGDLIVYRTITCLHGDEGKPENQFHYHDIGRVLGLAIKMGCGEPLEPAHFAVLQISTDLKFCYPRFIERQYVVASLAYTSRLTRWFFGGEMGFKNLDLIYRLADYGSLSNEFTETLNQTDPLIKPPRGAQVYPSLVFKDQRVVECVYDFEQWLTSYGALSENGVPQPGAKFEELAKMFFGRYTLAKPGEIHTLTGHAQRIDDAARQLDRLAQKLDVT